MRGCHIHLFSGFFMLFSFFLNFSPAKGQYSYLIGMDTTQSLANYDYIYGLAESANGNIWISGRMEKTPTSSGGQVGSFGTMVQLNQAGQIVSAMSSNFRTISTMKFASDGNFLIGGEGSGFMCTSGLCKSDMLVAKVTPSGGAVWGRSFGNPNYNGSDGFKCVIETDDDNVIVVGNIYQSSSNSHPFVAKLNGATGDTMWTRALSFPLNQFGHHASEGPAGELFIGVSYDLRVIKLNSSGAVNWVRSFANYGIVKRVIAQNDGSVIAAGEYLAASGTYNICLFKVSSTGNLLWFHDYDSNLPNHTEMIHDLITIPTGGFYISGYHYSNVNFTGNYPLVIKTDGAGNVEWSKTTNVIGIAKVMLDRGAGVLVGIDYAEGTQNNKPDILLVTLDANGGNDCFLQHPVLTGTPAITVSNSTAYIYTDYETQVTPTTFTNRIFWRKPLCNVTTGGLETIEDAQQLFDISYLNGNVEIFSKSNEKFNFILVDLSGRIISEGISDSGSASINLQRYSTRFYILRISSNSGQQVVKIVN